MGSNPDLVDFNFNFFHVMSDEDIDNANLEQPEKSEVA